VITKNTSIHSFSPNENFKGRLTATLRYASPQRKNGRYLMIAEMQLVVDIHRMQLKIENAVKLKSKPEFWSRLKVTAY
jgi:hypothetical protein